MNKIRRQPTRLSHFDYSIPGAYFVTICTYKHENIFGQIKNDEMILNEYGKIVESVWFELPNHYPFIELDYYKIMPNHVHAIIFINERKTTVGEGWLQ